MTSRKIDIINHWNIVGALQSPCCITLLMYVPDIVAKAVFHTFSVLTRTCSYASERSTFDLTHPLATSSWMTSWSGKGVTSFTVLSLCWHASMTVHSFLSFLLTHKRGAAWLTERGSHQPAFMYRLIFSWNSSHKE